MAVASNNEGKKWIQAAVAVACVLAVYVLISFFEKLAEWFALETMIPNFYGITQVVSVLIGIGTFFGIVKNPKASEFLDNVYTEVLKVVWPNRQQTWRHTVVIMIAVTIFGFIFGFFDF